MSGRTNSLNLAASEIQQAFADKPWADIYPPILSVDQAAQLLQIPKQTIYDWRSRGLLADCSRKIGKHVRFYRDRLIANAFNTGFSSHAKQ